MKKMPAVLIAVLTVLFFSQAEAVFAKPIDRFIGQIQIRNEFKEINGRGNKKFILYHGDTLIMERDNRSGKMWIIGKYFTDASIEIVEPTECVFSLQKTEISPRIVTFNININEVQITQCK